MSFANVGGGRFGTIPWMSSSMKRRASANKRTTGLQREVVRHMQNPYYSRPSFWVSDFHHRYLIQTGKDYDGDVPSSPSPGTYQHATYKELKQETPQRDTRALPIRREYGRTVYEERIETRSLEQRERGVSRARGIQKAHEEYWDFFKTVQQKRADWCRQRNVRSRGVYKPIIDATEIWG
eukprot:PhM_4_TR64/c0_g1_i1/m.94433